MAASGAWVAYDPKQEEPAVLFPSEIQAYRHANGRLTVAPWPFGKTLDEAISIASAPSKPKAGA